MFPSSRPAIPGRLRPEPDIADSRLEKFEPGHDYAQGKEDKKNFVDEIAREEDKPGRNGGKGRSSQ